MWLKFITRIEQTGLSTHTYISVNGVIISGVMLTVKHHAGARSLRKGLVWKLKQNNYSLGLLNSLYSGDDPFKGFELGCFFALLCALHGTLNSHQLPVNISELQPNLSMYIGFMGILGKRNNTFIFTENMIKQIDKYSLIQHRNFRYFSHSVWHLFFCKQNKYH